MGVARKLKSLVDDLHLLAVVARQVAVQQVLVGLLNHLVFYFGCYVTVLHHGSQAYQSNCKDMNNFSLVDSQ